MILLLLLPVSALAAGEDAPTTLWVGQAQITANGYWKTNGDGTLTAEGASNSNYNVYYDGNGTLTLNSATIKGDNSAIGVPFGAGIYAQCNSGESVSLAIELIGTNTITGNYGIYVDAQQGETVGTNASLLIRNSSDNGILEVSGSSHGIYVKSGTGDASLTINDASVVAKTTQTYSGYAGVCVQSSANATGSPNISLSVNGGSLTTSASEGNDGIQFIVGAHEATSATTSLTVADNAIVDARTGGIKATRVSTVLPTPTPTGENSSGIVFDGTEGTVYGDVTLQEDITIGEGESLTLDDGASLNTGDYTLTVDGGTLTGNVTGKVTYKVTGVSLSKDSLTLDVGGTEDLIATITPETATDKNLTWASDAKGVATVDQNGKVNAVAPGTANITVTTQDGSHTATCAVTVTQPVTGVTLDPTSLSLFTGDTATLTATVEPENATNKNVTWSSDKPEVATVDNGKVTAKAAGTATITVTTEDGCKTATCIVTVTVPVTGVKLNKETLELFTDGSETLTATVEPGNATNKNVTWNTSDNTVATVDENGTVTAVGAGEATITVTTEDGSKTATCIVTVTVPVTGVKLNKETLELFTDGSETLTATVEPGNATNKNVTWSSSEETIAIVDNNGTVTAVGAGEATITATAGGITATCVVHVRKPATVEPSGSTNLSFTTDRNEFTLTAIVYGENLSQEPNCWEWTVANTDVVSLNDTPNLRCGSVASSRKAFTIKGTGTTTITATYDDGTYRGSVDFKVRISKPTPPDPISYYNIYVEDVCDGVEVSTSKQVVREGGSINVYVEKDTANYTFDNFKVYYKEGYYDSWDELKEGTQPGEYPIKNIWTHIYIKAEGAEEKEDPTGIESIEGVKVYTKDGSLYVQTPQREQVIIVSMSGAVVKNEEQIGLKQYHGLQPGIYIVRVGDRAYKVRLN